MSRFMSGPKSGFCMEFTDSLKKNYEFRRVYDKGRGAATRLLVVRCREGRPGLNRLGITVSNKVGNAVTRNRIRRRIREIYRLSETRFSRGRDIVVIARSASASADYAQLKSAFEYACAKLGLYRAEGE